ncbi:methyl-accepting chemotaxis protein [Solimonas sp. K1W22B-7]|uniref:methyl-accepting chemotaxis protein n=1 Tax=Solimonas sp. K1W22B-7 TaxID=2303331 RepID=UPI000E32E348|nr:methyl-accepting chemotaxis protein [Solimonas sp. K1W22B-7]AXQ29842.1 methyl-accepting chemotaxis protein [Solimonas sp. K1W22B-7]
MAEDKSQAKGLTGSSRELVLLIAAAVLMAGAMGGFVYTQSTESQDEEWVTLARSIPTDVNEVAQIGEEAARGVAPDFQTLSARADDLGTVINGLAVGDEEAGIASAPAIVQGEVKAVAESWKKMKGTVDAVLQGEVPYKRVASHVSIIAEAIHTSEDPTQDKGIYALYAEMAERLGSRGASSAQIYTAAGQLNRLERIASTAQRVLSQGRDAKVAADALQHEVDEFLRNNALLGDAAARSAAERFEPLNESSKAINVDAEAINKMQLASGQIKGAAADVIATSGALEQRLIDTRVKEVLLPILIGLAGVVALLLIFGAAALGFLNVRSRIKFADDRDARQQQAILGLLDEITNLADGDLTVDVTVTEDFTGAIADSINYTVQNMRNLVGTINSTSVEIAASAGNTQQTAMRMTDASERQAREINAVTSTIASTAQSMQQVSARADQLALQAQQSVQVAHNGAQTVGRTIQGMAALREQIQDTSKRIKRLGESSQEIGNIIEFINDIAEQTNTLALNASIQAAMAGEAGRGFAVVADEVQRLAERAATATRQIENLVKTIQADTNEAIISMERSTQNVVVGAKSAEEAGQSLTRIESSSQELAKLITEISSSARNQSGAATKIAGTMQVIRDIAMQTSGSASQTAQAVGELNTLSEKLRESVSGFKLPDETGLVP